MGFNPGPTDIVPNAPLSAILKPLADNGGPTKTHALPAGSPALNASPANSGCKPTDQRGVTRPQGAACDIGAFEQGPPVLCNGQIARILGTVGNDSLLSGTPGPDVIHGLAGRDIIDGLEGNDIICGGSGADRLMAAAARMHSTAVAAPTPVTAAAAPIAERAVRRRSASHSKRRLNGAFHAPFNRGAR